MSDPVFFNDSRQSVDAARISVLQTQFVDPITSLLVKLVSAGRLAWISYRLRQMESWSEETLRQKGHFFLKSAAYNASLHADLGVLKRYLDTVSRLNDDHFIAQILARHPAVLRAALLYHPELKARFKSVACFNPFINRPLIFAVLQAKGFIDNWKRLPQGPLLPSRNIQALGIYNIFLSALFSGGLIGGLAGMLIAGPLGAAVGTGIGSAVASVLGIAYRVFAYKVYGMRLKASEQALGTEPGDKIRQRAWYLGSQQDNPIFTRAALGATSGAILGFTIAMAFPIPAIGPILGALIGAATIALAAMLSPMVVRAVVRRSTARYVLDVSASDQPWYKRQLVNVAGFSLWGAAIGAFVGFFLGGPVTATAFGWMGAAIGSMSGAGFSWLSPLLAAVITRLNRLRKKSLGLHVFLMLISAVVIMGSYLSLFAALCTLCGVTPMVTGVMFFLFLTVSLGTIVAVHIRSNEFQPLWSALNQSSSQRMLVGAILGAVLGIAMGILIPGVGVVLGGSIGTLLMSIFTVACPAEFFSEGSRSFSRFALPVLGGGVSSIAVALALGCIGIVAPPLFIQLVIGALAGIAMAMISGDTRQLNNPFFPRIAATSISGVVIGVGIALIVSLATSPVGAIAMSTLLMAGAIGAIAGAGMGLTFGDALPSPATPAPGEWKPLSSKPGTASDYKKAGAALGAQATAVAPTATVPGGLGQGPRPSDLSTWPRSPTSILTTAPTTTTSTRASTRGPFMTRLLGPEPTGGAGAPSMMNAPK